jgi:DNA-binding beta-propeller fold protein YncE
VLPWLLLALPALLALAPIPAEQRIPATVIRTFAGPTTDPMHMPTDLAIDSRGRAFVADGAHDRIGRFNADGGFDTYFAALGDQHFNRPVGVAIDPADRLWIVDTGNHRLLVASPDGALVETIQPPNADDGKPAGPTSVAFTPDGARAYIVDNANHRLLIRDNVKGTWTVMGKSGRSLGQFEWPFMICLGAENYVFITEAIGARVQQVSPTDRWAGTIGHFGVTLGDLFRPKGITADNAGRVYVGDSTLNCIQVFGPRGTVEGVLTDDAGLPLHFEHPMGMRFDSSGKLYVVELRANRVAVVNVKRTTTAKP